MKKYFIYFAVLSVISLASCKNTGDSNVPTPTKEGNVYVTCLETVDGIVGHSEQDVKQKLESLGWTLKETRGDDKEKFYIYSLEASDILWEARISLLSGNYVDGCSVIMTSRNLQTDLQDYTKFKKLFDLVGYAYKLSSGAVCTFYECEYPEENTEREYKSLCEKIEEIFYKDYFVCYWISDDEHSVLVMAKSEEGKFYVTIDDYPGKE